MVGVGGWKKNKGHVAGGLGGWGQTTQRYMEIIERGYTYGNKGKE
jgi:hypothetical protein